MASQTDVRKIVDALLEAPKKLAGEGAWTSVREGTKRFKRAVESGGEITPLELLLKAYPRLPQPRFRIILTMGRAIWRIDYLSDEVHPNPRNAGRPGVDPPNGNVVGPHFHAWKDNRRFATATSLPERLRNARLMAASNQPFEQVFNWFCAEVNIELDAGDVPEMPSRDTIV